MIDLTNSLQFFGILAGIIFAAALIRRINLRRIAYKNYRDAKQRRKRW